MYLLKRRYIYYLCTLYSRLLKKLKCINKGWGVEGYLKHLIITPVLPVFVDQELYVGSTFIALWLLSKLSTIVGTHLCTVLGHHTSASHCQLYYQSAYARPRFNRTRPLITYSAAAIVHYPLSINTCL